MFVVALRSELIFTSNPTDESPDVANGTIELYRLPTGPILQGDTVKIVCRVQNRHLLDIVRLVRHPLNTDARHSDVITTNHVIEGRFKVISRYKVTRWNEQQSLIELQISGETAKATGILGHLAMPLLT